MSSKAAVKSLIQGGQWDEAKSMATGLCQSFPQDAEAWLLLGFIHGHFENFGEAEQCCRRVTTLNSAAPVGHFNLGIALQKQGKFSEAAKSFQQAIRHNPKHAEALNELGVALQRSGEGLEKAIESYRQAVALNPAYAEAHYNLATALREQAMIVEAAEHFRKAIQLRPGMVRAHDALGQMLRAVGFFDQAYAVYREAVRLHAAEPELHYQFGLLLLAMGRNQEALQAFQRMLQLSPGNTGAIAGMAKVMERDGNFSGGYELLRPLLDGDEVDSEVALAYAALSKHLGQQVQARDLLERVLHGQIPLESRKLLHYALGKLYDEAKNYDQAFAHYQSANELAKEKFDLKKSERFFADLVSVFNAENMARRPRASNKSRLPVFIVGMPRSGTSLVEQILASHPEVYGAGELADVGNMINMLPQGLEGKVPYPYCLDGMKRKQLDEIAMRHLAKLAGLAASAKRVTDKMPHNFRHLGLIDMLFPGARVIHCMRDPLDTCLSIYSLNFNENHHYASDLGQLGAYYLQYQDLMAHWKRVLRIPILEVRYEEMVANQEEMTRKLVDFCELKWDEGCLLFHESKRAVATLSYDQVRRPIYKKSVARWKNYERHLGPLIAALGVLPDEICADE